MSSLKAKIAAEDLNVQGEQEQNRNFVSQANDYNPSSGPFPGIGTSFDDGFVNGTSCIRQNTKFDELLRKHGATTENQDLTPIKNAVPKKLIVRPQRSRSTLNNSKAVIEPPVIKKAEAQARSRVGGQLYPSKLRSYDTEHTLHEVHQDPKSPPRRAELDYVASIQKVEMGTHIDAVTSNFRSKSGLNSGQHSLKHVTESRTEIKQKDSE